MSINVDIVEWFSSILGRSPTEDDIAIFEQVFDVERGMNNPAQILYPLVIRQEDYDLFSESINLGLDNTGRLFKQISEIPGLYRILLFFNLLKFNEDIVEDGWIRSYRPIYSSEKIGYRGGNRLLNRSQYVELMHASNREFVKLLAEEVQFDSEKFPLRLIYAPLIDEELRMYPFSLNLHDTIGHMCRHESLEYVLSMPDRQLRDLSEIGPIPILRRWRRYPIQFYKDLYDVPTPELFLQALELDSTGSYGRVMSARLGDKIPIFMKYNESPYDTIHEYRIGRELNRFYEECPFVMYTYGLTNLRLNQLGIDEYVAVLDNQSEYQIEGDTDTPVLMAQWIPNSISFSEFIKTKPTTFRWDHDEIVEASHEEALEEILMAILTTLRFLWDKIGFVHGDLHFGNIQIARFNEPQVLPLPGYPDRVFNLSAVPVIIDYGFSTLLRPNLNEVELTRAIIPEGSGIVLYPTEARLKTNEAYVSDVLKVLTNMYIYNDIIQDEILYEIITAAYYRAFTGQSVNSSEIDILGIVLGNKFGRASKEVDRLRNRMIPLGLTTYDPDGAIEQLVEDVYRSQRIPSRRDSDETIDAKIKKIVIDEGVTISTYSGAIVYNLYPDVIDDRPTYSVQTLRSFEDLQQLLQDSYVKSLSNDVSSDDSLGDLFDSLSDSARRQLQNRLLEIRRYFTNTTAINLQYVYRYQINQMIKSVIPQ